MAQLDLTPSQPHGQGRLDVGRCALTGAAVGVVLFIVHWIAAAMHVLGMPMFAFGMMTSVSGLLFGLLCAGIGGLFIGALVAWLYNVLAFVARR